MSYTPYSYIDKSWSGQHLPSPIRTLKNWFSKCFSERFLLEYPHPPKTTLVCGLWVSKWVTKSHANWLVQYRFSLVSSDWNTAQRSMSRYEKKCVVGGEEGRGQRSNVKMTGRWTINTRIRWGNQNHRLHIGGKPCNNYGFLKFNWFFF